MADLIPAGALPGHPPYAGLIELGAGDVARLIDVLEKAGLVRRIGTCVPVAVILARIPG